MSDDFTPKLGLPYLLSHQAQKHVTLNESLGVLDGLVLGAVQARELNAPPPDPNEGEAWLIGSEPSGAWSAWAGQLAVWQDAAWRNLTPRPGWRFWDHATQGFVIFTGERWQPILTETQNLARLGLAIEADVDNPLSARLNAALFTAHEVQMGGTGDVHVKLNKETETNSGAVVWQSGYHGRAELGLLGDDTFRLKLSENGNDWHEAYTVEPAAGRLGIGTYPDSDAQLTVSGRTRLRSDTAVCTWHESGRLELSETGGAAVTLQATSPGSPLHLGAVTQDGNWLSAMFDLQPDEPALVAAHKLRPQDHMQTDLGAPDRAWRDIYVQNPPRITSQPSDPKAGHDIDQAHALLSALRPIQYRQEAQAPTEFGFIESEFGAALNALGFVDTKLWRQEQPGIAFSALIPVLVAGYQQLSRRLTALEAKAA